METKLLGEINLLAAKIYRANKEKGFWPADHKPGGHTRDTGEALMLMVEELCEALQADREGITLRSPAFREHADGLEGRGYGLMYDAVVKGSKEEELPDIAIRILDFCGGMNIRIRTTTEHLKEQALVNPNKKFGTNLMLITCCLTRYYETGTNDSLERALGNTLALADIEGIDMEYWISQKLRYNSLRPYKHGKNY